MSDQRSEQPTVLEPTDERVLLLVAGERDRGLLADRLDQGYEVVDGDPDDVAGFDLCIVDARSYRQAAEELSTLKRAVDTYLPVLLLVEDRERVREAEWLAEEVGGTVDDVLVIPTPRHELDASRTCSRSSTSRSTGRYVSTPRFSVESSSATCR